MLMDLTMRVVDRIRSGMLAGFIRAIITRLTNARLDHVNRVIGTVGVALALRLSAIGNRLGCKSALHWVCDRGLIQFLAITYINLPNAFKASIKTN